ncbi:uncharacterized protein ASCRUDRAFT_77891 [Ascoidea rubescens DSM 1968]|uniref:Uncharacterized protein n=1 Tax=Ascoidea rubescens DSM 1968 TaxID=1344418 RepID=A0A1D2V9S9_9ASCO|nr:hypothetical protein ASCRUDRAFT_77891 [Ascoidea rubescens DSM 1968]ODV58411.1 hypothetical protein ASCRUDRAFT_77891 [Ascoidea rubescens DSM 1968]
MLFLLLLFSCPCSALVLLSTPAPFRVCQCPPQHLTMQHCFVSANTSVPRLPFLSVSTGLLLSSTPSTPVSTPPAPALSRSVLTHTRLPFSTGRLCWECAF